MPSNGPDIVAAEPKRDASRGESAKDVLTNGDLDKRSDGRGLGGAAAAGPLDGTKCAPTGAAPHAKQDARTPHGAPVETEAQVSADRSNPSESHSTPH